MPSHCPPTNHSLVYLYSGCGCGGVLSARSYNATTLCIASAGHVHPVRIELNLALPTIRRFQQSRIRTGVRVFITTNARSRTSAICGELLVCARRILWWPDPRNRVVCHFLIISLFRHLLQDGKQIMFLFSK